MNEARETHRHIEITQNGSGTYVACDCGWSDHLFPSWGSVNRMQRDRVLQVQRADMRAARQAWNDHKCSAA